jgi:hypothetical protein
MRRRWLASQSQFDQTRAAPSTIRIRTFFKTRTHDARATQFPRRGIFPASPFRRDVVSQLPRCCFHKHAICPGCFRVSFAMLFRVALAHHAMSQTRRPQVANVCPLCPVRVRGSRTSRENLRKGDPSEVPRGPNAVKPEVRRFRQNLRKTDVGLSRLRPRRTSR